MTRRGLAAMIVGAIALVACERPASKGTLASSSSASSAALPATTVAEPSFRRDIVPFLARSCAAAEGCHGAQPTHSVDLDLRADAAFRELVERETPVRKGALRVRPGDPARSFLVDKLTGRLGPNEGKAMPLDPDTGAPLAESAEQRAFVEKILIPWIRTGARDD